MITLIIGYRDNFMKKQFTKEERLIIFFNDKFEKSSNNEISIYCNEIPDLNMSEQEASRTIHLLQEEKLLRIKQKSLHNDFSIPWTIALMPSCIHYFDNKKSDQRTKAINFFKEFRAWVTLVIAVLSFILAA